MLPRPRRMRGGEPAAALGGTGACVIQVSGLGLTWHRPYRARVQRVSPNSYVCGEYPVLLSAQWQRKPGETCMLIQATRSSWLWSGHVSWSPARLLCGLLALPASGPPPFWEPAGWPGTSAGPAPPTLPGLPSPPLPGPPSPLISAQTSGWNPRENLTSISTHPTPSFSGPLPFLTYFPYSTFNHVKLLKIIPKEQKPCLSSPVPPHQPLKGLDILGWRESSFGFSCKMVWENPNQLFGQLNIYSLLGKHKFTFCSSCSFLYPSNWNKLAFFKTRLATKWIVCVHSISKHGVTPMCQVHCLVPEIPQWINPTGWLLPSRCLHSTGRRQLFTIPLGIQ